ncbi:hypothetical protein [Bordetella holmesii]|nr:hypothetical protein [Bordetella holmesii]
MLAFAALIVVCIVHTFDYRRDYYVPAEEVLSTETARTRLLESHV